MDLNDKVFTVGNTEYLVIADVKYDGKQYAYLVNKDDESDSMYREVIIENNDVLLRKIDKKLFRDKIIDLFVNEIKK